MKRIQKVTIHFEKEPFPDYSYLGEYSDDPGTRPEWTLDMGHATDCAINMLPRRAASVVCTCFMGGLPTCKGRRYFVPAPNYDGLADAAAAAFVKNAHWKMEGVQNGSFFHFGISASADVQLMEKQKPVTLKSTGLWGIESDFDTKKIIEIEIEQLNELAKLLREVGFSNNQILNAFTQAQHSYA